MYIQYSEKNDIYNMLTQMNCYYTTKMIDESKEPKFIEFYVMWNVYMGKYVSHCWCKMELIFLTS